MVPAPFIVVVVANVLFPLPLRDAVLRAAAGGFYQLRWSADILDEMERNLIAKGRLPPDKAARLRSTMEGPFPEAEVTDYAPLVAAMQNDPTDRHVAAAGSFPQHLHEHRWIKQVAQELIRRLSLEPTRERHQVLQVRSGDDLGAGLDGSWIRP